MVRFGGARAGGAERSGSLAKIIENNLRREQSCEAKSAARLAAPLARLARQLCHTDLHENERQARRACSAAPASLHLQMQIKAIFGLDARAQGKHTPNERPVLGHTGDAAKSKAERVKVN